MEELPIAAQLADNITEIEMDGGSEIYTQLCAFLGWRGRSLQSQHHY